MCSSLYSMLNETLPEAEAKLLMHYLESLTVNAANNITISRAAAAMQVSVDKASKLLMHCFNLGILSLEYAVKCPECGLMLKRFAEDFSAPEEIFCNSCEEKIPISSDDIVVVFSFNSTDFFVKGQQEGSSSCAPVAPSDTLTELIKSGSNLNKLFFNPSDADYQKLEELLSEVSPRRSTTKKTGDTLEKFTQELFTQAACFTAGGVRTTTNQIDCFVRNRYLSALPFLGQRIIIECKNENKKPDNSYFLKLTGIIDNINCSDKSIVKLGIIVSKAEAAKTVFQLARTRYIHDGLVVICICLKELRQLISSRENLIEFIERKRDEVILDATSDLKAAGIFD